jgi:hypothetical protein
MMKKLLLKTKFIVSGLALFSLTIISLNSFGQTVVNFTTATANSVNAANWVGGTAYTQFQYIYNNGNLYRINAAGTSDVNYPPTGTASGTSANTSFLNTLPLSYGAVAFSASATYNLNQYVFSAPNLYLVTAAGTASATSPTHTTGSVLNGTVAFDFVSTYVVPTTPIYEYIYTIPLTATWTCPAGVTSVQVEAWGAGGGGGGCTNAAGRSGGGGGGGSYVKNTSVAVTPGTTYTVKVGAGGLAGGTGAATAFGMAGGLSSFEGDNQTVIASGGTGASGGTTAVTQGLGGVLGGVYGFTVTNSGVPTYSATSATVTFSGGSGTGASAKINTSSSTVSSVVPVSMGSGFTSTPTITITSGSSTPGTGATGTAIINANINAGGTITIGADGTNATTATSGAGASGANGGAGGATVPLPASGVSTLGNNGVAPGGGGSGAFSNINTSVKGGFGAVGQVTITYTTTQPVKMTSFAASKQGAAVQLKWSTASEQNNAYFDVQKSSDGQTFTSIGTKAGAGNSNAVLDYFFTDRKPSSGLNYYRLNQVDADGKSTLSNPVAIDFGFDGSSMEVYTTKNVSVLSVNIKSGKASTGKFVVYNIAGQKVLEQAISLNSGSNEMGINLPDLKKGIYVAAYQSGNQILTQKFIR